MIDGKLPDGWTLTTLGDICSKPQYGWTTSATKSNNGLRLVRTSDISDGTIDWTSVPSCADEPMNIEKYLLAPGDILVSRAGSIGISHVVEKNSPPAVFASYLIRFRPLGGISSGFIKLFLNSREYWQAITEQSAGIAIPNVNASKLSELELLLPPRPEQYRILEKIEPLLGHLSAARERLERLPLILKKFRQSVLRAACDGRLTEDFREMLPPSEKGSQLCARIRLERISASGGDTRSLVEDDSSEQIAKPTIWEVPESWTWTSIQHCLSYSRKAAYGVLQPGPDTSAGVPFIRICDLHNGTVNLSEIKHIAPEIDAQYPRTRLSGGEVLVSLVGTIGRVAIAPPESAGANVARAIAVLPLCPHLLAPFLQIVLSDERKNKELVDLSREVARKTLNLGLLKAVSIPLPPTAEQQEIVRRVQALFSLANIIERRVKVALARTEKLPQAILSRAFAGELVPTEAALARVEGRSYETAKELVALIQSERVGAKGVHKTPIARDPSRRGVRTAK